MNLILLFVFFMIIGIWHPVDSISTSIADYKFWRFPWTKSHEALLYNSKTEQLHDAINEKGNTNCIPCITACPAEGVVDRQIIKDHSLGKNSIFFKYAYKEFSPGDVQTGICLTDFEPTMLFDKSTSTYETGYELYYSEDNDLGLKPNKYFYDNLIPASKVTSNSRKLKPSSTKKTFKMGDGKTYVFYWIPVLSLKFNPSAHQIRASFKKDAITNYRNIAIDKCFDYALKSAKNVNFFNFNNDRFGMFDKLYVPIEINPNPASNESPYLHSYGGLERAPLVPVMFLHTGAAKNASCTPMNSVPIWTSILEGHLQRIDRYLYAIYRMWPPKVNIIFGVTGISKVKVPDNWVKTEKKFEVKEDPEPFDVSYPEIIYRVIEYGTGTPAEKSYALIIIHNDRTATKDDKLCETTDDDWTYINNDDSKTGISYVCPLTQDIAEQLGVYDSLPKKINNLQISDMNPIMVNGELKGIDERGNIISEMKLLFGENMQMPLENVKMTDDEETKKRKCEARLESKYGIPKKPKSIYKYPEDHRFWVIDGTAGEDF